MSCHFDIALPGALGLLLKGVEYIDGVLESGDVDDSPFTEHMHPKLISPVTDLL
jgi:hypothetical protein